MNSLYVQLACTWEASARKPGNVHRFRDFSDCTYLDFLLSAAAIGPLFEDTAGRRVGEIVLEGVRRTRAVVASNTNLGILLLLTPLALVPETEELGSGVARVLAELDVKDSQLVFEAIRLASPGGLGRVPEEDVHGEPTRPLREIMSLAAERDMVAGQYANGFREVLDEGMPVLARALADGGSLEKAIILCHLHLMSMFPDSLIIRKAGRAEAGEAQRRAKEVLTTEPPLGAESVKALAGLDRWLRARGNLRNPGTSADLVTASLFVALRQGIIKLPLTIPWSAGSLPELDE